MRESLRLTKMASRSQELARVTRSVLTPRTAGIGVALWLAAVGVTLALFVLLSIAIKYNPIPSQDLAVMDWMAKWHNPGLSAFFAGVSLLTSKWARHDIWPDRISFPHTH